jgi:hypothetical protein
MHSKRGLVRVLATAVIVMGTFAGCVKKRGIVIDDSTVQDQKGFQAFDPLAPQTDASGNQKAIAWKASPETNRVFKRSEFVLTTGDKPIKNSKNSVAESLTVESDVTYIKHFNIVSYETQDPYLKGTSELAEMLGEPGKTYGIAYEITPNFLVLNKIVTEDQISTTEKTYARKEQGEWIVPIGGFDITFYNQQLAKNDDDRQTNRLVNVQIAKENFMQAKFFKIDPYSFKKFERQEKFDVLARAMFENEWYFSETNVESRLEDGTTIGNLGSSDVSSDGNFSSATRIIFKIQGESLVGLNTNVDPEFKINDDNQLNYKTVVKIPIEPLDYFRETNGADILKEKLDEKKKQEDRSFVKLDYLKSETPQSVAAASVDPNTNKDDLLKKIFSQINNFKTLLDVTYGVDYFSFTLRDAGSGSIKRFAFRKIDPAKAIQPRRAFIEDNYLLGTFTTIKAKKDDFKLNLKEDQDKLILMSRHNPDKDIVYFFTDQTPKDDWHRNIGREAVNIWNQAFQRIGAKISIRMDESKDIPLGDIRYNAMNIVKRAGAGLLGYGPSLIDSESGEIVSASMNMGMDNMMDQYFRIVRDFIGRESGRYYNFKDDTQDSQTPAVLNLLAKLNTNQVYLDGETGEWALLGTPEDGIMPKGTRLDPNAFSQPEQAYLRAIGISPNGSVADAMTSLKNVRKNSYAFHNMDALVNFGAYEPGQADSSTVVVDSIIRANCKEVVELAERQKDLSVSVGTVEEIAIIEPCVKLFAQADSLTTVLHEMGHNLSMRHNFAGSIDARNFPKVKSFTLNYMSIPDNMIQSKSSSVMDYLTVEGQQIDLGGYDLANLRWIYKGEVEDKQGNIIVVDPTKPIAATIPAEKMKAYSYCTDEQKIYNVDPMCDTFDQGVTAKESVRFRIEQTYNTMSKLYRYDTRGAYQIAGSVLNQSIAMKEHYDNWRMFLRRHTGLSNGYLQKMTVPQYEKLLADIRKNNPKEVEILDNHLQIRNMIVKFLVDVAFVSNKYCLVEDTEGQEKLIELEKIRLELTGIQDFSVVSSCKSASVLKYLADSPNGGYTLKREFGYFLNGGSFDLDPNKIYEVPDFAGTANSRIYALAVLTNRISPAWQNIKEGYATTFLDEPDIRAYVEEILVDRLVNGVRVMPNDDNTKLAYAESTSALFGDADIQKVKSLPAYNNFSAEASLTATFANFVRAGLVIPGTPDDGRLMQLYVGANPNREQVVGVYPNYVLYRGNYLFVSSNDTVAGRMMKKYQELVAMRGESSVDPDALIAAKATILKAIPANLPATDQPTIMEVVKLATFVSTTVQKLSANEKNLPLVYLLQRAFAVEMEILNIVDTSLQNQKIVLDDLLTAANDPNADPKAKAQAQQILSQPLTDLYTQMAVQDPTVKVPNLANVEGRIDSVMVTHAKDFKFYKKNTDELDAQSDGLLRLLQGLAQ